VEPDGATFSWLRLPSGSRPRLHRQLHGRSHPATTRLAGLRVEPELERLLKPHQTGTTCSTTQFLFSYVTTQEKNIGKSLARLSALRGVLCAHTGWYYFN
jgi:hypothetical protein